MRRREAAEQRRTGECCEDEGSGRARGRESLVLRREGAQQEQGRVQGREEGGNRRESLVRRRKAAEQKEGRVL